MSATKNFWSDTNGLMPGQEGYEWWIYPRLNYEDEPTEEQLREAHLDLLEQQLKAEKERGNG